MAETDSVASFRETLPPRPGVYRYFDAQGQLLYVGKARNLKRRVNSYFQRESENPRIRLLVSLIADIQVTLTVSETEALLLESNLIKTHQPRFNILFRDDKSYPYLQITAHDSPRLAYYRGKLSPPHAYFGPYPNAWAAREALQHLQKLFLLRTCEDSVFRHRTRACLLYQVKRCSGPCVDHITPDEYGKAVELAKDFLAGRESQVLTELRETMNQAAEAMEYERAARLRDRLALIQQVLAQQTVTTGTARDVDILALIQRDGEAILNLTMIRQGRHIGDRNVFPEHAQAFSLNDIRDAFLSHHYEDHPPPRLLVSNLDAPPP
ncbi:MAG: excinuclease ABC subunit C, partial [Ferrovum sp.]|nr:excinuclease ABC subunit C [Ferrovum sp.]